MLNKWRFSEYASFKLKVHSTDQKTERTFCLDTCRAWLMGEMIVIKWLFSGYASLKLNEHSVQMTVRLGHLLLLGILLSLFSFLWLVQLNTVPAF